MAHIISCSKWQWLQIQAFIRITIMQRIGWRRKKCIRRIQRQRILIRRIRVIVMAGINGIKILLLRQRRLAVMKRCRAIIPRMLMMRGIWAGSMRGIVTASTTRRGVKGDGTRMWQMRIRIAVRLPKGRCRCWFRWKKRWRPKFGIRRWRRSITMSIIGIRRRRWTKKGAGWSVRMRK